MGPFGVVVPLPSRQLGTGVGQRAKERLVQMLIAQPAIEAFHEGIVGRLSRPAEVQRDTVDVGSVVERPRDKFRAVV